MLKANIKIELWYLDFMHSVIDEVANSVKLNRLSSEKAIKMSTDAILSTIKYGIVVEQD